MKRRELLVCGGPLLSTSLAGCVDVFGDEEFELCSVTVRNGHPESIEATVRIREGDETRFEHTETFGSPEDGYTVPETNLPDGPGEYLIEMKIADRAWERLEAADVDADRTLVEGIISERGDGPGLVVVSIPELCAHVDAADGTTRSRV
ncbi:hypothetical protein [Halovivax gelatinilyticus]|uniref:hypothetical protein n=1 Tax=Halovivax gelatinilyticus TaxID=2961597 RepID=UPI0020CA8354|nr:hypothetical protein [Halovivax gelatinilyticus]